MSRAKWSIVGVLVLASIGCNRQSAKDQKPDDSAPSDPMTTAAMEQGSKEAMLVRSASNLRYVGKAMIAYAASHGGAWPNGLSDISSSDELLDPSDVKCPVPGRSYVYHKPDASALPSAVVAFEQPAAQAEAREGINVLHRDGSVELIVGDEARKIVAGK